METETTVSDVALDIVAALDMYEGLIGSETTRIDQVGPGDKNSIVLVLSDGSEYRLAVSPITTQP